MFTFACHCNPFVILILSFLRRPRAPSFASRIVLLRILTQVYHKLDAWLELYFELITDQLEVVSPIFFVPHAFVLINVMGLIAVLFLAMGACVLLWLVVLVLHLFIFLTSLGLLGFLVLAFALRISLDDTLSKLAPYADLV